MVEKVKVIPNQISERRILLAQRSEGTWEDHQMPIKADKVKGSSNIGEGNIEKGGTKLLQG